MEVELKGVGMHFLDGARKVELFSGLDFKIAHGDAIAIIGRSGVGKSTLLNLIGTLEAPTAGEIFVGGNGLNRLSRDAAALARLRNAEIGFVFQFHHLFPEFDAVENVALPLRVRGMGEALARQRAIHILERVGLAERLSHRPGMLSGGEQQRVAIARALVGQPGLILADEPTGNLDEQTGGEIQQLLLEVQRELRATLIVVTHSPDFARAVGRVVELSRTGLKEV